MLNYIKVFCWKQWFLPGDPLSHQPPTNGLCLRGSEDSREGEGRGQGHGTRRGLLDGFDQDEGSAFSSMFLAGVCFLFVDFVVVF